jgi:hypothetical protein
MNKKGFTIGDTLMVLLVVFVFVIAMFVGKLVVDDLNADIQADSDISAEAKAASNDLTVRYPALFDGAVVLIFVLLYILVLVASYQIDTYPIFFAVTLILLAFAIIAGMFVQDFYTDIIGDAVFSGIENSFPMTNFLLSNIVMVILVVGFSVAFVLYAKSR